MGISADLKQIVSKEEFSKSVYFRAIFTNLLISLSLMYLIMSSFVKKQTMLQIKKFQSMIFSLFILLDFN